MSIKSTRHCILAVALCAAASPSAPGLDTLSLKRDGKTVHVAGEVVVEAEDGGLLLMAPDGELWVVQADEIVRHVKDERVFKFLDKDEMAKKLLDEMPDGFRVHRTAHYVICYNTSDAYARWCGALYERLYKGFYGYWRTRRLKLDEPKMPLVALVFDSKDSYIEYAKQVLGEAAASTLGHYNLASNRVVMYDLTGVERERRGGDPPRTAQHVNLLLRRPGAERTVATIVHEATHQIAFNSGLQQRFTDVPLWLSEGIAVYFETPDLNSSKGWRTIGKINAARLTEFRKQLNGRPADALEKLLQDDKLFQNAETAGAAYNHSWALTYFLIRSRPMEYVEYLKLIAARDPIVYADEEERVEQFKSVFGDLDKLEADFLRVVEQLRVR